ncbi:hypothetical protein [Saccharopolyspora spinosa]|uniref:Lipoprotein LpqN n=1 Tax=Saccharopolyspora spinosa TaxID=60894 RepID=A0A2N3YAF5_SACSN|nr:hypothetical protein [Saccharopolyspora spinosa]PKW19831.1 hypothetical protein A8926_8029 [Saccharopolyspora spinosa]
MATSLPTPIEFRLPKGWQAVSPDAAGAPGAAFVAIHPATNRPGFTTNITIDGEHRSDAASLAEIADESINRLHQAARTVSLSQRTEFGSADAPGLTQLLRVTTLVARESTELIQCQVYLSMSDVDRPQERAVIRLSLTATEDNFKAVIGDFQEFVASVRPESPGSHSDQ